MHIQVLHLQALLMPIDRLRRRRQDKETRFIMRNSGWKPELINSRLSNSAAFSLSASCVIGRGICYFKWRLSHGLTKLKPQNDPFSSELWKYTSHCSFPPMKTWTKVYTNYVRTLYSSSLLISASSPQKHSLLLLHTERRTIAFAKGREQAKEVVALDHFPLDPLDRMLSI